MAEPDWDDSVAFLTSLDRVPAALATGGLLANARARWLGRVVPRTSMHDLLFTLPGDDYPFANQLRVSWSDGVFEFSRIVGDALVVSESADGAGAEVALDAHLTSLVSRS